MAEARQPPYSVEAEQCVLGGMLLDNRCIVDVLEHVTTSEFYRADHRAIFDAIVEMSSAKQPCDFVTLAEHLRRAGQLEEVGGLSYIGALANDTPSAANVTAYADLVHERAVMRALIAAGGDLAELGYRPDGRGVVELVAEAQRCFQQVEASVRDTRDAGGMLKDVIGPWSEALYARQRMIVPPGIQTGFKALDAKILGLEPGDYMVLAARPSMGKTTLAMNIAEHIAGSDGFVQVFSLEMRKWQIVNRMVASHATVPLNRIRDARQLDDADMDALTWAMGRVRELPIYIDDRVGMSMPDIRAAALRRHRDRKTKLVVIDYLQHVAGDRSRNDSRTNEVDEISRSAKRLAGELECPVIALSQLNRGVENRDDKRPRMSDLREAGGIEQDADVIAFIYRDEVYHPNSPHKGVAEIIIAKQRNGELGKVEVEFRGEFCKFSDYHGPGAHERAATVDPERNKPKRTGLAKYVNGTPPAPGKPQ